MLSRVSILDEINEEELLRSLTTLPRFNWDDCQTIEAYQKNLAIIEDTLGKLSTSRTVHSREQQMELAKYYFELATYYLHIDGHKPQEAGRYLELARNIYKEQNDIGDEFAWIQNHLALCHQQMQAHFTEKAFAIPVNPFEIAEAGLNVYVAAIRKEEAMQNSEGHRTLAQDYCNEVSKRYCASPISPSNSKGPSHDDVKIAAFAYCVKALTFNVSLNWDLQSAIDCFKLAILPYTRIPEEQRDNQFARAKCGLAYMYTLNGCFGIAEKLFAELKTYWEKNSGTNNLYQLNYLKTYQKFLAIKEEHAQTSKAGMRAPTPGVQYFQPQKPAVDPAASQPAVQSAPRPT